MLASFPRTTALILVRCGLLLSLFLTFFSGSLSGSTGAFVSGEKMLYCHAFWLGSGSFLRACVVCVPAVCFVVCLCFAALPLALRLAAGLLALSFTSGVCPHSSGTSTLVPPVPVVAGASLSCEPSSHSCLTSVCSSAATATAVVAFRDFPLPFQCGTFP